MFTQVFCRSGYVSAPTLGKDFCKGSRQIAADILQRGARDVRASTEERARQFDTSN